MNFRDTTLGDVCLEGGGSINTGPFGSQLHASDYSDVGTPVVMPQDIGENSISTANVARVSNEHVDRLARHRLFPGDIVYSRRGDVERRALIRDANAGWLCGTGCLRVSFGPESLVNSEFISYYLGLPETRGWIVRHAVGATMPNLNTGILSNVPLSIPDLSTQQGIAEMLGALDDKIAANVKLAALSERLLAAMFIATEIDREPGPGRAIALTDLIDLNPKLGAPTEAEPVYVDMQRLPTTSMHVATWTHRAARGGARFQNGDTLLARITPCLENRKAGYVDFLNEGQVGLGSTEYIVMRGRPGHCSALAFFVATSDRFREFAIRHMAGTSGRQRLSARDLARYELTSPKPETLARFEVTADSLMPRVGSATRESAKLAVLRDALLPQLMSGKIKVKDAERVVEGAV